YGGTGAGYNPLAMAGQPRLSALEFFYPTGIGGDAVGAELALLPNSVYFNPLHPTNFVGTLPGVLDPFSTAIPPATMTNVPRLNVIGATPAASSYKYPTAVGLGGANESYDAADFQNMFLALQTVTPRSQGRVVQTDGTYSAVDPALDSSKFLRLDLEDVPLPSFHRPDLINFWYHRMLNSQWLSTAISSADQRAVAILQPYDSNGNPAGGLTPQLAAAITAIKRQASLRPLREDHPRFDGGNPMSVASGLPSSGLVDANSQTNLAIPYWEAVGPWDVDNDNDGVPDSIWVDLGDPVQQAEDGTRYKPLYALLIIDLDSRLNVNAHGLAADINPPDLATSYSLTGQQQTGAAAANLAGQNNSNLLAQGVGYGPAEISLRPVFPAPLTNTGPVAGNRSESAGYVDDYAAALIGRANVDNSGVAGKYGLLSIPSNAPKYPTATPGLNYEYVQNNTSVTGESATPDLAAQLKFFNYPWIISQASAFGTPPDLFGRYSLGLGYTGQPVYEVLNDPNSANTSLYRPLLTDSPYELNLNGAQRRDTWASGANASFANAAAEFSQSLAQNDDAPFAPADLEKVLRAHDADAGTLASRLWDCVNAFDPVKLMNTQYGDPLRVSATSSSLFGSAGASETLTAAQQLAGINRRLITTESSDLPVVGKQVPSYIPELGVDGLPGNAGVDDDPDGPGILPVNGITDDAAEIGAPGSDDFEALTGTKYSEGTILDVLRYRIQRERIARGIAPFLLTDPVQELAFDALTSQLVQQQLPADLVAGERMDLNRPFGDGRDNNGDGVVDDPLEAGEPFLDVNGNGHYDSGEPYIDLDGNGGYAFPSDQLWAGLTGEPIAFDYTNGVAVLLHPAVVTKLSTAVPGGVRNLESQGRQQYARQLYCLMLLLVDEGYIAPWDENDPQLLTWMENEKKKLTAALPSMPAEQADFIVKRKHTCRLIAQWAVNCADMRDSDVIMTPFEYDENPWDGWGCMDRDGNNIPLDGDPSTNENGDVTSNQTAVLDWKQIATNRVRTTMTVPAPASPVDQTRGVVWGAERPELLITETLAFHDRRTEDLESRDTNGHDKVNGSSTSRYKDIDLDQSLRPVGSAFVEVYNPWAEQGQYPAELYTRLDGTTNYQPQLAAQQGVDLGRLSNFAVDGNGNLTGAATNAANGVKRSPVWRMIVVEEWPNARNVDFSDMNTYLQYHKSVKLTSTTQPKAYSDSAKGLSTWLQKWKTNPAGAGPPPVFRPTNPDFDLAFDSNFVPKQVGSNNQFTIQYPYIEREFYFTTDKSPVTQATSAASADWKYGAGDFKLRIPDRSMQIGGPTSNVKVQTQKFIALDLETASPNQPAIAPILPGRYGVIGSAGTRYNQTQQVYVTTIGRHDVGQDNTPDSQHIPNETRRIEMRPVNNAAMQQLMVAANGGDPQDLITMGGTYDPYAKALGRDNELIIDQGIVKNVADANANNGSVSGTPNDLFYNACVSIPVDGMSLSEPAWGYGPREKEAAAEEAAILRQNSPGAPSAPQTWIFRKTASNKYEGRYMSVQGNVASYDKPFDTTDKAPELGRTGTTANYRTVHLQRLANPLLPWNPEPFLADGKTANPEHRPNLPINPYRTVDTSSANVTAYNGVSRVESDIDPTTQRNEGKMKPWIYGQSSSEELTGYLANMKSGKQVWYFHSIERGFSARLNHYNSQATPPTVGPQRILWLQEPAMRTVQSKPDEILDLIAGRQMSMRFDEVPGQVKTDQKIYTNMCDMVLEHSLGFGNDSMGTTFDKRGSQGAATLAPTTSAVGAPAPTQFLFKHHVDPSTGNITSAPTTVNSTNPWLAWNNRPFISAEELLGVPLWSQATMLRYYSAGSTANPYDGTGIVSGNPATNAERWAAFVSPFGHLANFAATTTTPADLVRDNTGKPVLDANNNVQGLGAPHFYRILDYVQVPSRYVGTETMLNAETFNDVPGTVDTVGTDITGPADPRYAFQPPFNKVSREQDPGLVNLNTVTGRREPTGGAARIWSEVFDGIMHRDRDRNLASRLGHLGPAWRDIVLSRRGYAQRDAAGTMVDKPVPNTSPPDAFAFGLNNYFPSFFSNPFRSPNEGDLVPLAWMMHYGVDAGWMRRHHFNRGGRGTWGSNNVDDNGDGSTDDTREAGFAGDDLVVDAGTGALLPVASTAPFPVAQSGIPLLSESFSATFYDGDRNPGMYYQPLSRLGNLVTNRSGTFAVWVTVGYFEVERAPDFSTNERGVADRCSGDPDLYNRIYPDGYMLGREVGSDTGDTRRPRGFYIIDRTEAVGFKPGEDLNVEKLIRLRR
ncbi:MAG: hypothetical protein IT425_11625, partial [Pirellulales bacterium]|nr:hypothetical protein [Pirellulales bacterium]